MAGVLGSLMRHTRSRLDIKMEQRLKSIQRQQQQQAGEGERGEEEQTADLSPASWALPPTPDTDCGSLQRRPVR